jgi:uncharacterized protein (TIGR02300 family)
VAKPELGTKRLCAHCSAKFYDLNKDPIVCPKCGAVHEIAPVVTRGRPDAAAAAAAARPAAPAPVPVEEVAVAEPADAEFVSLEEADAEAQGAKKPGEATEAEEEEVEMDESIDDAAFIEEQEEEDADVTDIIGGDIENEEEG